MCRKAGAWTEGQGYLPRGFVETAWESRDPEALWTAVALYHSAKEMGLAKAGPGQTQPKEPGA